MESKGKIYNGPRTTVTLLQSLDNGVYNVYAQKKGAIFPQEIDIMRQLVHPNIMRLVDFTIVKETVVDNKITLEPPSITMPLVAGTLETLISGKKLDHPTKIKLAFEILFAVSFLHNQGILHLDIKPTNILYQGREKKMLISDFGLSVYCEVGAHYKTMDDKITSWYRPPECFKPGEKTYSSKSDIWSVGIVLLELFNKEPSLLYEADADKNVNYLAEIEKNFNDDVLYATLERRVKDKDIVEMLTMLININPEKRIELIDVLSLDIFHLYLDELPIGSVVLPLRVKQSIDKQKSQQKGLTYMIKKIFSFEEFSQFKVSMMFLAVDIYHRINLLNSTDDYKFRAMSCLTLAYDLLTGDVFPDVEYEKRKIYKEMWNIVSALGGLLYPQYIYFKIWNDTKLLVKMYPILRSVENYNNFDLDEFLKNNMIEKNIDEPLTVGQYHRLLPF